MGETVDGGLAERCRVGAHAAHPRRPTASASTEAAALPVAYGTAYRMMLTRGRVEAGEKVLVLGARAGSARAASCSPSMAGAE